MASKPVDHYTKIAQLTKQLVDSGECTVTELAHKTAFNVGERRFYSWLNGDAQLYDYEIQRGLRYLSRMGHHIVHTATYTPEMALIKRSFGSANGTTKDDMVNAVKAVSGADDAFDRQDKREMRECIDRLQEAVADLEAEYELLP